MIDGVLYAPNGVGLAEAFDASTGKTRWVQEPFELELSSKATARAVWPIGPTAATNGSSPARRVSVRAECEDRQGLRRASANRGRVNLDRIGLGPLMTRYYWTGAPLVIRDVVVIGASDDGFPGDQGPAPRRRARLRRADGRSCGGSST